MTFPRALAIGGPAALLLLSSATATIAQGTLHTLRVTGPNTKRINIVVLAEGYLASQEGPFLTDATNAMSTFHTTSPWGEYRDYFNEYAIFVASNEEGSDHHSGGEPLLRDTYFNSTYDSYGIQRLITIPPNDWDGDWSHGAGKVYALLSQHLPDYDVVLILVNDPQYGGSGGEFAIASVHAAAPEVVLHELGHSYADLGDEYEDPYPGYPDIEEPNTTRQTDPDYIKWRDWILLTTPIPTPELPAYSAVVGLFEGAHYHSIGWYRPMLDCKMRSLGIAYCRICAENIVLSHYGLVSPIDSMLPVSSVVTMAPAETETLRVVTKVPLPSTLRLQWTIDGSPYTPPVPGMAIVDGVALGLGTHAVKCVVSDTTTLVRIDSVGVRRDSAMWSVIVQCVCPCHGDPQCDSVANVQDVVQTVNVAFRGVEPMFDPDCPRERTDVNCDSFTTVQDVVKVVNVSFRGASAATEFCNPCVP
ncbi:MAG: M64 family metallopeptidase [Candidatus Zixiibacteriota bacterium]